MLLPNRDPGRPGQTGRRQRPRPPLRCEQSDRGRRNGPSQPSQRPFDSEVRRERLVLGNRGGLLCAVDRPVFRSQQGDKHRHARGSDFDLRLGAIRPALPTQCLGSCCDTGDVVSPLAQGSAGPVGVEFLPIGFLRLRAG